MPILKGRGKRKLKANFHELRHGRTFKKTARKFGKKKAIKQMQAIALSAQRKTGRKRRSK